MGDGECRFPLALFQRRDTCRSVAIVSLRFRSSAHNFFAAAFLANETHREDGIYRRRRARDASVALVNDRSRPRADLPQPISRSGFDIKSWELLAVIRRQH